MASTRGIFDAAVLKDSKKMIRIYLKIRRGKKFSFLYLSLADINDRIPLNIQAFDRKRFVINKKISELLFHFYPHFC